MKKRIIGLTLLGLVAYSVFLIATLPAARAWAWFGGGVPLQAYGLDGTLWSGRAAVLQDQLRRLEAVQWQLRPVQLLLGRVAVDATGRLPDEGRLRGNFKLTPSAMHAEDLKFDLPATTLLQWAEIQLPVKVDGRFDSLLQELAVSQGRLIQANGIVNWHSASLNLGRQPLPLGNIALRLEPADGAIKGTLMNQGSPLQLGGDLRLTPDGKFVLDINARLAGEADEATRQAFVNVGVPADGSPIQARLSGSLDGTGVRLESLNG